MRFTPQSFFSTGIEPCVTSYATGAVSSSLKYGSVNYDVYVFTCSQQTGGGETEGGQLFISEGYSRRAIVVCVAGGGGGSSDGNGGGGGQVSVAENVFLGTGEPYNIVLGQGGNGTERVTQGVPFSGEEGSDTRFYRGSEINLIASGGLGGNLGGNGGSSGDNHSSGSGGAGASQGVSDNSGGQGYSIFLGKSNPKVRAGGGGQGETFSGKSNGWYFGGGEEADGRGFGIDGSGGESRDNIITVGGGGTGGQYFDNTDSVYRSSKGGGGAVLVAIPTNLCSSSLYIDPQGITTDEIITQINSGNAKLFGKNLWTQQLLDSFDITNLIHTSSISTDERFYNNYTSSLGNIATSGSDETFPILNDGIDIKTLNVERADWLAGEPPMSASIDWSIEWIGVTPSGDSVNQFDCIKISDTPQPLAHNIFYRLYVDDSGNGNLYHEYFDGTTTKSAAVNNNYIEDLAQHVLTYNSTTNTVKYYINATLENSISVSISSSLDNPYLTVGNNSSVPGKVGVNELRLYQKELSISEIEQNISASLPNLIPPIELLLASGSDSAAACSASLSSSYYISHSDTLQSGTLVYQDSNLTTFALDAWYKESGTTSSFEIVSGSVTNFGTVCPPNPISINLATGSDSASACNEATTSLYYYGDNETFVSGATLYTDISLSITASNNWYREIPSTSSFEVTDGIRGDDLTCGFDCELWRFTAGSGGGTATYTFCGDVTETVDVLGPNQSVDICLISGSSKSLTGAGATINYLGTC